MSRRGPVLGLSWLQLIAGALAAMTSAWVASYLGVAGTIIGAAVGSLVASIASAVYVNGLDRSTTLITSGGSVVSRQGDADDPGADEPDRSDPPTQVLDEVSEVATDEQPGFSWRHVWLWAGGLLAISLLAIGGYELVTGTAFGRADNPSIGRPWEGTGDATTPTPTPDRSASTTAPTTEPTTAATTPTVEPTTEPTTVAPTTEPTTETTPDDE